MDSASCCFFASVVFLRRSVLNKSHFGQGAGVSRTHGPRGLASGKRQVLATLSFPVDGDSYRGWNCCFVHPEFSKTRPNISRNAEGAGLLPSDARVAGLQLPIWNRRVQRLGKRPR